MALINCPHCGETVSDKAVRCPHCGESVKARSLRIHLPNIKHEYFGFHKKWLIAVGCIVALHWLYLWFFIARPVYSGITPNSLCLELMLVVFALAFVFAVSLVVLNVCRSKLKVAFRFAVIGMILFLPINAYMLYHPTDVYAQESMADYYFRRGDNTNAMKWYRHAAKKNSRRARFQIGEMYEKGIGVEQNYKLALDSYKSVIDEETYKSPEEYGDNICFDAYGKIAGFYEKGLGVEQNYEKALEWYENSFFQVKSDLGKKHIRYDKMGLLYNKTGRNDKAVECFLRALGIAIKRNDKIASARKRLAGFNDIEPYIKAVESIEKGDYEKEYRYSLCEAYEKIGLIYEKAGNKVDAVEYLRKALEEVDTSLSSWGPEKEEKIKQEIGKLIGSSNEYDIKYKDINIHWWQY